MHENGIKISALSFAIACALAFVAEAARAQGPASSNDPFAAFSDSLTVVPAASTLNNRGQFYVPVFSSIRMGGGRTRLDLAVTLSIHNASETEVLVLERVDYFNTAGTLVQSYLARPIAVRQYGTVEVFIAADDVRGGTGANFLVGWAASRPIAEPVIEAVMIGNVGTSGYSFAIQGQAIRIIPH
jgi:Protein of unknown function (DUF3124)